MIYFRNRENNLITIRANSMIGWFNIAAHTRRAEAGQVVDRQGVSIVEWVGGGKAQFGGLLPPHQHASSRLNILSSTLHYL